MNPDIELTIEELVLHGFSPHNAHHIGQAVERELGRLFSEQGLPGTLSQEGNYPSLQAGPIQLEAHPGVESTGAEIARAVYQGFIK